MPTTAKAPPRSTLRCAFWPGCQTPATHVGEGGDLYCRLDALAVGRRTPRIRTRQLTPVEIEGAERHMPEYQVTRKGKARGWTEERVRHYLKLLGLEIVNNDGGFYAYCIKPSNILSDQRVYAETLLECIVAADRMVGMKPEFEKALEYRKKIEGNQ